jgi:hypothetical protein
MHKLNVDDTYCMPLDNVNYEHLKFKNSYYGCSVVNACDWSSCLQTCFTQATLSANVADFIYLWHPPNNG